MRSRRRRIRRIAVAVLAVPLLFAGLFVANGLLFASRNATQLRSDPAAPIPEPSRELTVVAYNIAKGWAPRGGVSFHDRATVERRLRLMADAVRPERPDVVVLSEAMTEAGTNPVDQVAFLAGELGLPHTAFGENYNFGLPFPYTRVVGGNAVLSRFPLTADANIDLAGRKPFFVTSNNRRALFVTADLGSGPVLIGSLHNDSFDPRNNAAQVREILAHVGDRPCILAGDFNAKPGDTAMSLLRDSGKFGGAFDGPPSFTGEPPPRRIDYVLGPAGWEHVETRVIEADPSDHRPVVARFRRP
ncbi:MAG: endonuclease/exonuclease/phosphatase family protein [Fimbriiglobus sp.]